MSGMVGGLTAITARNFEGNLTVEGALGKISPSTETPSRTDEVDPGQKRVQKIAGA